MRRNGFHTGQRPWVRALAALALGAALASGAQACFVRYRGGYYAQGGGYEVYWRGRWYPAQVLAAYPNGTYLIHYVGYSSSWDEVVGPARIRVVR